MDVAKDDEDPILCGQDAGEGVANRNGLRGIGWVLGSSNQSLESRPRTPPPAKRVECAVARDAEEPGFRIANVNELGPLLERGEKGLLQDVLGERPVSDDLNEELAEPLLGRREERLENRGAGFRRHLDSTRRHIPTLPHGGFL